MIKKILTIGLTLLLAGCATREDPAIARQRLDRYYEEQDRLTQESNAKKLACTSQVHLGMSPDQISQLKACLPDQVGTYQYLNDKGKLQTLNIIENERGYYAQVKWGDGYLYFRNNRLVTTQR